MTYDIETRGRRLTLEVRPRGRAWEVTLDGRTLAVDVTAVEGRWSLLIGPPIDGSDVGAAFRRPMRSYEVALEGRGNGERLVHVNGRIVPVAVVDPRSRLVQRTQSSGDANTGPRSIVAPMPGRVVKVLVKAGDVVAAHQGLVVVEAMKMENELRAPAAGTVIDVRVKDRMSVDAGAVLIVME